MYEIPSFDIRLAVYVNDLQDKIFIKFTFLTIIMIFIYVYYFFVVFE